MSLIVRAVGATEWRTAKAVRLAALAEAPQMFGSTLAREQQFDDARWRNRFAGTALAWNGASAVGIVGWVWTHEPDQADLVSMWVHPSARGTGLGYALVDWVVAQVVQHRSAALELGVVHDNVGAINLYQRAGFATVGTSIGDHSGNLLTRMRYAGVSRSAAP